MPARRARNSSAAGKSRPSLSSMKLSASPPASQPKQWNSCLLGETVKEGVRSSCSGHRPTMLSLPAAAQFGVAAGELDEVRRITHPLLGFIGEAAQSAPLQAGQHRLWVRRRTCEPTVLQGAVLRSFVQQIVLALGDRVAATARRDRTTVWSISRAARRTREARRRPRSRRGRSRPWSRSFASGRLG